MSAPSRLKREGGPVSAWRMAGAALGALAISGCAVATVAGAAVSVGAAVVGTAVEVTVGAAKVTGKVLGSAVDAVSGPDGNEPPEGGASPERPPAATPKQP